MEISALCVYAGVRFQSRRRWFHPLEALQAESLVFYKIGLGKITFKAAGDFANILSQQRQSSKCFIGECRQIDVFAFTIRLSLID